LVQVVGFFYVEKVEAVDRMASLSRFQDSFLSLSHGHEITLPS
jgi:hypothetical protein